jgi:hypothetical protein
VVEELNLLAYIMKRRKEENYQTKKSLSLIADLEADCAMTISEHFQTEFNL